MIFEEVQKNGFTEKITEYFQNVESMLNKDQGFSFPQTSSLDSLLKTLANIPIHISNLGHFWAALGLYLSHTWAALWLHLGCIQAVLVSCFTIMQRLCLEKLTSHLYSFI